MSKIKTLATKTNVTEFLNENDDESKRKDSLELLKIFKRATGEKPLHYVGGMIGFGIYHYKSARSKQEGDWPLAAFACRKNQLTLYGMNLLAVDIEAKNELGKFKLSGSCLHIKKLNDVNIKILEELIRSSYLGSKKLLHGSLH